MTTYGRSDKVKIKNLENTEKLLTKIVNGGPKSLQVRRVTCKVYVYMYLYYQAYIYFYFWLRWLLILIQRWQGITWMDRDVTRLMVSIFSNTNFLHCLMSQIAPKRMTDKIDWCFLGIIANSPLVPAKLKSDAWELFEKYYPIEIDVTMSREEKTPFMWVFLCSA